MAYMSQQGYDDLVAKLQHMESVDRPAASAAIAEARDKGDLSENAEYDAAKEALAGRNNIGKYLFFRTTDSAMRASDYLTYTEFYIIKDHVFYKKNW